MQLKRLDTEDLEIILGTLREFAEREAPLEKRLKWDEEDVCPEDVVRSMTSEGMTRRAASLSTCFPLPRILSSGAMAAESSTTLWSRKGTRASRPHAIVMLSTRLTGSSVSITVESILKALSTGSAAPLLLKCSATNCLL